jgi:hypothetical protein
MKTKTRKFYKNGLVSASDDKYTGEEPSQWLEVDTKEKFDRKFSVALNFYNYYLDRDDYIPIIHDYMHNQGYDKKDCKLIQKVPKTAGEVSITGKMCRMFNMGMNSEKFGYDYESRVKSGISVMLSQASLVATKPKVDTDKPARPNVHEIMKEKVRNSVLCELEGMLDTWCTSDTKVVKFPIASVLRGENIPVSATGDIKEWLNKQRNEYNEAFEKTCDQMVEGYSYLSKPALRNRIKALDDMLNELVLYKSTKAAARKPRIKKPKAATKQVEKLKYLKESKEYAMQSCDPTRIIGANKFIMFNTKYRKLTVFTAKNRDGFIVSGSTLKDFEDTSYSLTLRKPEDILPILVSKTEKQIEKALNDLKTKRKSANGRINQDTILVRAL